MTARGKRVRWECPAGKHPAVLGSTRPLKDATVRFCLPCSEESGRLVARVAPSLEAKRAAKTAAATARRQRAAERERERKANALQVPVLDRDGAEFVLDADELLREAWRSKAMQSRIRDAFMAGRAPVPELVIRRGRGRAPWREAGRGGDARTRDTMSGHAQYDGSRVVLTVGPGLGHEWLRAIIVHEAAHGACHFNAAHGSSWRSAYLAACRELYPDVIDWPLLEGQAAWRLDEQMAEAILKARRA